MKKMLTVISLVSVCALLSSCSDKVRSKYTDKESAMKEGGLVEKGWMPEDIPDTSKEIVEWHNLDVNTGAGQFTFDLDEFPRYLVKMESFVMAPDDIAEVQGLEKHKGSWKFFLVKHFVIGIEEQTGEGFWYINPKIIAK